MAQNDFWIYDPTDKGITALSELNTEFNENDLFVDPYERYIIFNRYYHTGPQEGDIDLMISFRQGEKWLAPRILEGVERKTDWELTPFVDHNLEYLYYEFGNVISRFRADTDRQQNPDVPNRFLQRLPAARGCR